MSADGFIPLSVPNLSGRERELVLAAIDSEWVSTAGPYVSQFEKDMAAYLGVESAVACQSGTAGLHVALLLSGATQGTAVLVPALTFIAAVNPVKYLGAEPVFLDCDDSLCMDPSKFKRFCEQECEFDGATLLHKASGLPVKAMVVVHVFGNMADMEEISSIARKYKIKLIEDATEALGTKYLKGGLEGAYAGTIGDFGVYSFNGNKIITTGGGGMIVANKSDYLRHAAHLTTQAKSDPVMFEHDEIGFNYRLTNVQAALGIAQLEQLEEFIRIKDANHKLYASLMEDVPHCKIMPFRDGTRSNKWFYSLVVDEEVKFNRDSLISRLSQRGVQTRPIWGIICDQLPYRDSFEYDVVEARGFRDRIINLPCSTNLTFDEVKRVVAILKEELTHVIV